jgi:hypothetical protein
MMEKYKDLRVMNLKNFLRAHEPYKKINFNFGGTSSILVMHIYKLYELFVPKWIWFYGEYNKFGREKAQFQTTKSLIP